MAFLWQRAAVGCVATRRFLAAVQPKTVPPARFVNIRASAVALSDKGAAAAAAGGEGGGGGEGGVRVSTTRKRKRKESALRKATLSPGKVITLDLSSKSS